MRHDCRRKTEEDIVEWLVKRSVDEGRWSVSVALEGELTVAYPDMSVHGRDAILKAADWRVRQARRAAQRKASRR